MMKMTDQQDTCDPQTLHTTSLWAKGLHTMPLCVTQMPMFVLQMLMKLHDDDDYQKDVGDPKALDAIILLLQKHPDRFER